jgi:hypothetical protein
MVERRWSEGGREARHHTHETETRGTEKEGMELFVHTDGAGSVQGGHSGAPITAGPAIAMRRRRAGDGRSKRTFMRLLPSWSRMMMKGRPYSSNANDIAQLRGCGCGCGCAVLLSVGREGSRAPTMLWLTTSRCVFPQRRPGGLQRNSPKKLNDTVDILHIRTFNVGTDKMGTSAE